MEFIDSISSVIKGVVLSLILSLNYTATPALTSEIRYQEASSSGVVISEAVVAEIPSPIPTNNPTAAPSTPEPTSIPVPVESTPSENYLLEDHPSGEDGFYVLKNVPDEPMGSVDEINQAVNSYRQNHGLGTLHIDSQMCDIANQRATEAKSHFSHDGFQQHIEAGDYNYTGFQRIGENLWQGAFSGVHIVEFGWDRSEGHRANLQGDWTRGCAGVDDTTAAFIFAK